MWTRTQNCHTLQVAKWLRRGVSAVTAFQRGFGAVGRLAGPRNTATAVQKGDQCDIGNLARCQCSVQSSLELAHVHFVPRRIGETRFVHRVAG